MISQVLFTLSRGWARIQANSKLAFLCVVLFVFPLLFVVVLERFYVVAEANIQTIDMQAIGLYHDSASAVSVRGVQATAAMLQEVAASNPDITDMRLLQIISPGVVEILHSSEEGLVGSTSTTPTLLSVTLQEPNQTFTTTVYRGSKRYIQAARAIDTPQDTRLYLFTEHDRSAIDFVLAKRKQDAYIVLTILFGFIIGLAYWINRQSDWEQRYKKLSGTLRERDLFSNMIAHEFRTPLTAIKGYASFLQESTNMTPEEARFADTIRESAERLVLLVNDFLEVARIQSGKMKLEIENKDIRGTITTVTDTLVAEAQKKDLQLIYTPALQPQPLATDHGRLVQILTNIISNSIKYTDVGTVEVSCEQDRRGLVIRVKDTGSGISAEDQQKLFAPFSRVGGVEKTSATGTGLGMWITKQMIELLDGDIAVESIKSVGTHVVMHFRSDNQ